MDRYLELRRQSVHILLGLFFLAGIAYNFFFWWSFLFLIVMAIPIVFFAEKIPLVHVHKMLSVLDRKNPFFPGFGAFSFVFSFALITLLFPVEIALPALVIMVVGDGIATLIGHYSGRYALPWNKKKTWEGSLVGVLTAMTAAGLFLPLSLALASAAVALLVESLPLPYPLLDDNVLMPLAAALLLLLVL